MSRPSRWTRQSRVLLLLPAALALSCAPRVNLSLDPASELPVDPIVRSGMLDNGLTWYVQGGAKPDARAELRLVIRAGSNLEDEDQRGLAHVLEHMAFNGSEHFTGNGLIQYFESIGMSFGAHVNAYTSFDETVYMLTIPTDRPEFLQQGLLVLRDQAGGLLLSEEEIQKERGVVLEERRARLGAGKRISEALQPLLFYGSRYLERDPIGTESSLNTFTPEALRRFYADWYRPDLMAVMVVGDLDRDEVTTTEALLQATFGTLKNPAPARPRPAFDLPAHPPLTAVLKDAEVNDLALMVTAKYPDHEGSTLSAYETFIQRNVLVAAINERLALIGEQHPEVLGAGTGWERITPTTAGWSLGVGLREGKVQEGIGLLLDEVARLQQHGITQGELDRAREIVAQGYLTYSQQQGREESADAVDELLRVFLNDEPMPGVAAEVWYAKKILPEIDLGDLAPLMDGWMDGSLVVALIAPERATVPSEAEIAAWIAGLPDRKVDAPLAEEAVPALDIDLPAPGKILSQTRDDVLGLTTWTLSNGMTLHIKQTGWSTDQVILSGWSKGGLSAVADADYFAAALRGDAQDGIANLSRAQLDRLQNGVQAGASLSLERWGEGFTASSTEKDVEAMFRLLYAQVTAPRFRQEELDRNLSLLREDLAKPIVEPDALFSRRFNALLWGDPLRSRPWTPADVADVRLADIGRIHRERFGDMGDFDAMIIGSMSPAQLKPLVLRWLASLPGAAGKSESEVDDKARMAPGITRETLRAGKEPRARYRLRMHGDFQSTWESRNHIGALTDILEVRLREVLREEKGGVYGVGVSYGTWDTPFQAAQVSVDFTCDPERVEELRGEVFRIIQEMREKPLEARYTESEQEINRRERELSKVTNGFWLSSIEGALSRGEDPSEILTWDERNDAITPETMLKMAQAVLRVDQYVELVMLPE